jgi:hypothetical protein
MSKIAGGRKSPCGAFTAGTARIPGMGPISICAPRSLTGSIGDEERGFNLSPSILPEI